VGGGAAFAMSLRFRSIKADAPIDRDSYKSWSLFLVTNQRWLNPANRSLVLDLFDRSQAFGRVIGDDHLAVWFWKVDPNSLTKETAAAAVNVERAVAYCRKLNLAASAGPYLMFTTIYPDEDISPSAFGVIELGSNIEQVERLLDRLGDQLVRDGFIHEREFVHKPGTDDFWTAWFDATRRSLTSLGYGFRVTIKTPTLSLQFGRR
jgi:hypothetical protein